MRVRRSIALLSAVGALAAFASGVEGQEIRIGGGVSQYDLSGTGTSWVAGARWGQPLASRLEFEVGTALFRYEDQSGEHDSFLFPEVGLALGIPLGPVPLYVAAGAGWAFTVEGDAEDDATLFGAVGVDAPLSERWTIRPELRVRSVDPWVGTLADFTLSIGYAPGG